MKKKVYICLTVIAALLIIGNVVIYCALPKYIVYALRTSKNRPVWEKVYKIIYHDKAHAQYNSLITMSKAGLLHHQK